LIGNSAVLKGAKILFFAVFIFARYPICSLSSNILSHFLISILCDEKNFNAFHPVVVSGFPNITPIFILIWFMNIQVVPVFAKIEVNFLSH